MIQPLANRVLIKPDAAPTVTESGLFIPDNAVQSKNFEMSGTVVRTGTGPASAHRVREAMIARFHKLIDEAFIDGALIADIPRQLRRELNNLAMQNVSEVQPGDHVAFPYTVGEVLEVDGERYLLMTEDQISAVLERKEVAA